MKPYVGNEKFIFISYAHKDSKEVYTDIDTLQNRGYRIWYDKGIAPASEWDNNIACHIEKCDFFIAFISKNYIISKNCEDEVKYARNLNKNILLIYIEECQLSSGMAMRLNRLQYICKFSYSNYNEFIDEIETSDEILKLKDSTVKIPLPESVPILSDLKSDNTVNEDSIIKNNKIEYHNGDIYQGETLDGKRHGYGFMIYSNGNTYIGEWAENKFNGHGIYNWKEESKWCGDKYDGEWKDDKRNGHGIYYFSDGRIYDGKWENNRRNGIGTLKYPNGNMYVGNWENDIMHGHGTYIWGKGTKWCGDKYEGNWENNIRQGYGIYYSANGDIYEGEFLNNMKSGRGVLTFANSDQYDGEFFDGYRYGNGIMNYYNGDKYDGNWKFDKRNGKGTIYYSNGKIKSGLWLRGFFLIKTK